MSNVETRKLAVMRKRVSVRARAQRGRKPPLQRLQAGVYRDLEQEREINCYPGQLSNRSFFYIATSQASYVPPACVAIFASSIVVDSMYSSVRGKL